MNLIHQRVHFAAAAVISPLAALQDVIVMPFAVIGRVPIATAANRRPIVFEPLLVIGAGSVIGVGSVIYLDAVLGAQTLVGDHTSIREGFRCGDRCVIGDHVSINYDVVLEDDVRVMPNTHLTGGTRIGRGSFIGAGVTTSNDRRVDLADYSFKPDEIAAPIIGRGVMVGSGANILAGVTIGDGATIAAGALVVKNVPPGALVIGPVATLRACIPKDFSV